MKSYKTIRTFKLGLLAGALVLCLPAVLTSCIDETVTVVDCGQAATVSSQFSLALPQKGYATRMPDGIVQATDNNISLFRGIEDIKLIPFGSTTIAKTDHPIGISPNITSLLKPSQMTVDNAIPAGTLMSNNYSALFSNVDIPLGTHSVLFYGKAIDADVVQDDLPTGVTLSSLSDDAKAHYKKHKNGALTPKGLPLSFSSNPAGIQFELESITSDDAMSEKSAAMVDYLNSIVTGLDADGLLSNSGVTAFLDNKAGCSSNVHALVTDLYNSVGSSATNTRTAVLAGLTDVTYNGEGAITSSKMKSTLDNYPANLYLPDGAAAVEYVDITEGGVTSWKFRAINNGVSYGGMQIAPPHVFTYPTALYYRADSRILTSDVSRQDKYIPSNSWSQILGNYGTDAVQLTTRSVAIQDPVQYAVGRLDMSITAQDGNILDRKNQVVAVPDAGFPITAVLISTQLGVDYTFNAYGVPSYTVYDTAIGTVSAPRAAYLATHSSTPHTTKTLVLQTASTKDITDLTATPYHVVYVAVEFKNTLGTSFVGHDEQIIPEGCHFYLVGMLDPTQLTGYDIDDPVKSRVFTQDHITTVNFTITSLADAYNVIPDLRNSELKIGLTIDTNWQVGSHFTDNPIEFKKP